MTSPTAAPGFRADARRNRAKVLAAAQRAFAEHGFAVSLGEIARRAGVGAGTVYRHFPGKEDLLEAVLSQRIERLTKLATDHSLSEDPGEGFFAFITEVLTSTVGNKDLCEIFETRDGWPRALLLTTGRRFSEALERLLTAAHQAGAVRADVDIAEVQALLTGCVAIQRYQGEAGRLGPLTTRIVDTMRPRPGGVTNPEIATRSRDENPPPDRKRNAPGERRCPVCGDALRSASAGRPARYCGSACRQKAYRQREPGR